LGDDEGVAGAKGVGEDGPDPDESYGYAAAGDRDDVDLFSGPLRLMLVVVLWIRRRR